MFPRPPAEPGYPVSGPAVQTPDGAGRPPAEVGFRSWLKHHPGWYGALAAGILLVTGAGIFQDVRPGVIGAIVGGPFTYWFWRPRGVGWRIETNERRHLEKYGSRPRWTWIVSRLAATAGAFAAAVAAIAILTAVIGD